MPTHQPPAPRSPRTADRRSPAERAGTTRPPTGVDPSSAAASPRPAAVTVERDVAVVRVDTVTGWRTGTAVTVVRCPGAGAVTTNDARLLVTADPVLDRNRRVAARLRVRRIGPRRTVSVPLDAFARRPVPATVTAVVDPAGLLLVADAPGDTS